MDVRQILGNRFSNGMKFSCENYIDLNFSPTDRDNKLFKKWLESNAKRSSTVN